MSCKKKYEYWSSEGKKWTNWFDWDSDYMPEFQMEDRRVLSRLKNHYEEYN